MTGSLRIVALGDSITNGAGLAGVKEAETFREITARELTEKLGKTVEVVNAGVNFLVKDYAQTMRDVAAEKQVALIDVYRAFDGNPARLDYFPDGLHPDARGHRVIADLLVARLSRMLSRQEQ